ncbi:MAG: beta-lactamase family protein [Acidimicrobiia bacterium]|nr:beta-lactamase family protein [Acidimicrobiia bacterium]
MYEEQTAAAVEELLNRGIADGAYPGAQFYSSVHGEVVADIAVGEARLGTPMTTDTVVPWQCNTKPVTATAVCQLVERGRVELDAPVVTYLPEFGARGKQDVTLRHLLTHTAGFSFDPPGSTMRPVAWDEVERLVCEATLMEDWTPGGAFRYSAWLGYATLGVVVSRVEGRPFSQYVRDEVFEPLGMGDCWIGVDTSAIDDVASRMASLYDMSGEQPVAFAGGGMYQARHLASCYPATGGVGPVRQLARLWESLRQAAAGRKECAVGPRTARAMVRQGVGPYGLGVLVAPSYFGDWCPMAFGHDGMQSTQAFVDPDNDVVIVAAVNGLARGRMPREWMRNAGRLVYDTAVGSGDQPNAVKSWIRRRKAL